MKTIKQALIDEIHYPIPLGFVENKMIERQLNGDDEFQERLNLQRQGVKSYKLGDLSETFGNNGYDAGIDIFVYDTVFPFLRNWLSGGYKILPEKHHCGN